MPYKDRGWIEIEGATKIALEARKDIEDSWDSFMVKVINMIDEEIERRQRRGEMK